MSMINNQVPEFKGAMIGILTTNPDAFGANAGSIETLNQHGLSVFQNPNGYIGVQGNGGNMNTWYSQATDTLFDFSGTQNLSAQGGATTITTPDGTIVTVQSGNTNAQSPVYNQAMQSQYNQLSTPYGGYASAPNTSYGPSMQTYQWGAQFLPVQMPQVAGNGQMYDANGEQQELTAADLQKLVDSGVYDSLAEAYEDLGSEYAVSDEEQAKLGIYSKEDEAKIKSLMQTTGMTRQEAINKLGDKIEKVSGSNPSEGSGKAEGEEETDDPSRDTYNALIKAGKTPEEALESMEKTGTEISQDLINEYELSKYSTEDQETIKALLENPDNEDKTVAEIAEELGLKKTKAGEKMKTFEATEAKEKEVDDDTKDQIDANALEKLLKYSENDDLKGFSGKIDELAAFVDDSTSVTTGDLGDAIKEMQDMGLPVPQAIIDQFELSKFPKAEQEKIKEYADNKEITISEAIKDLEKSGKVKHDCSDESYKRHFESTPYGDIDPETGKVKKASEAEEDDED